MRARDLHVRFAPDEIHYVLSQADAIGISRGEFVRRAVLRDRQGAAIKKVMEQLEAKLASVLELESSVAEQAVSIRRLTLIVEEIALARDAQILVRVAQRINTEGSKEVSHV